MSSNLIIVVEDHPDNRALVKKYLSAKGYRVLEAESCAAADALIAVERPRIVLIDFSLPGEDGMVWVERHRQSGAADIAFIALTAHTQSSHRDRAMAAGCEEFISKPIVLKSLLKVVEDRLGPPQPT